MKISKLTRRVKVTPAFLFFLCAYYYFDPAGSFSPFLLSICLHELGHLAALWLCKTPIHRLRLTLSGTVIQTAPQSYRQEILTAAVGPLMNLLLAALLLYKLPEVALLNIGLFLYNLLPIYPLDGGRMLRSALHLLLSPKTALIVEKLTGILCVSFLMAISCYLTCVLHAGLWPILIFFFLFLRISETILPKRSFCS